MKQEAYAHRYSKIRVLLTDAAGKPLANTKAHMKLTKHEFLFGSGAFDFLPACSSQDSEERSFYQDRVEKWSKVFNYGTLPFYWGGYEPTEGDVQFESRMNAAKEMAARNITPKGHPLCWQTSCCEWLLKYDDVTILDKQLNRIHRDVTAFKGVIPFWDVINETVIMPVYDRYENAATRMAQRFGRINLIKEVFAAAHAADPEAVFLINDFNLSEAYRQVISECLDAGIQIDAIGLQTHQHQGYRGREWLEEVVDRFSGFGLPLHFTENTLVSGHIMPAEIDDLNDYQIPEWPTTPEGEARQEAEWKEMYEFAFSNPHVAAITGWDFADGAWLGAPSGVIRKDNSLKPSYETIRKLIHEEWMTEEDFVTDENGYAEIHGLRGEYEISCGDVKGSLILQKNSKDLSVALS